MTRVVQIPSFLILTFHEHSVKLIRIKDGFYDYIDTLDRGLKHLKQILIGNNVIAYHNATDEELQSNSMATQIMTESIQFYATILYDRVKEHHNHITTCIINPPYLKNNIFLTTIMDSYHQCINGYIVPNTIHKELQHYERNRQMNELDVLAYMNFMDKKQSLISSSV